MLKDYIEEEDNNLSPKELIIKYKDEFKYLCIYDKGTKNIFGLQILGGFLVK